MQDQRAAIVGKSGNSSHQVMESAFFPFSPIPEKRLNLLPLLHPSIPSGEFPATIRGIPYGVIFTPARLAEVTQKSIGSDALKHGVVSLH